MRLNTLKPADGSKTNRKRDGPQRQHHARQARRDDPPVQQPEKRRGHGHCRDP